MVSVENISINLFQSLVKVEATRHRLAYFTAFSSPRRTQATSKTKQFSTKMEETAPTKEGSPHNMAAPCTSDELNLRSPHLQGDLDSAPAASSAPATINPSDKVIATYELLENILSHLDTRDLVRIQRVSFAFESTIKRSKVLQQSLFLVPRADLDLVHWIIASSNSHLTKSSIFSIPDSGVDPHECMKPTRLGKEYNDVDKETDSFKNFYREHHWIRQGGDYLGVPKVLNPLIFLPSNISSCADYAGQDRETPRLEVEIDCFAFKKIQATKTWGRMLLTQPPVARLGIFLGAEFVREDIEDVGCGSYDIENANGLTVADIASVLDASDPVRNQRSSVGLHYSATCMGDLVFQFEKDCWEAKSVSNWTDLKKRLADGQGGNYDSRYVEVEFVKWMTEKFGCE